MLKGNAMTAHHSFTLSLMLTVATAGLTGCDSSEPVAVGSTTQSGIESESALLLESIAQMGMEPMSTAEMAGLITMREEEKLARDVYTALSARWQNRIFANIAKSEQAHMDALLALLKKYQITDPAGTNGPGAFTDTTLQNLYGVLMEKGSVSAAEALQVGALIEDLDIADLKRHLSETDNTDITLVYDNLERGSRNHMRSFSRNLSVIGVTYTPQFITQEEYTSIIATPMETGRTR